MKKFCFLLLLVIASSCDDAEPTDELNDGQREAMLRALATNVIGPGFEELHADILSLDEAVEAFVQSPDAAKLNSARQAWITLGRQWKRMELYQQGPLDQDRDSLIFKIDLGAADHNNRATLIPQHLLEAAINAYDGSPSPMYVKGMPALLQGIPAIEDMLFNESNGAVLEKFTIAPNAEKRRHILEGLVADLSLSIGFIQQGWGPTSVAFQEFVGATGTDLGSSLGMLMNDIVYLAEQLKNQKIGRPAGYFSSQIPQPDSVEARWSVQSLPFFIENLNGIEEAFTSDAGTRTGVGIDSLLNFMDAKVGESDVVLSEAVITQINTMRTLAQTLGSDLPNAVRTNRAKVDELFAECLVLLKLFKVDVVTQLGVMITTLEGDGD